MSEFKPTDEQRQVLENLSKSLIVSASAGSGKTSVLVQYIATLVIKKRVPIKKFLVLTFTNVAADEMKSRLLQTLSAQPASEFLYQQIDDLPNSDICTIDSFCERVIKKNIEKLTLDQTFSVLDEAAAQKVRFDAFEQACQTFMQSHREQYWQIFGAFRRNRDGVFDCMRQIENFFDASHNDDQLLDYQINCQPEIFEKSCQIVLEFYLSALQRERQSLQNFLSVMAEPKAAEYAGRLLDYTQTTADNIFAFAEKVRDIEIPLAPRVDKETSKFLSERRASIKDIFQDIAAFSTNADDIAAQKSGNLSVPLLEFYKVYKQNYKLQKDSQDLLDFADIEKLCAQLLQDEGVRETLQNAYEYVFVDEYQDTNTLQANLIKTISKICNFVAVGDPKQAIYGFRNATMEIMKEDIAQNSQKDDGNVVYLRGNFRSDKRVLDFVNRVFQPIMTEESSGIDYRSTSMLEGKAEYEDDGNKAVDVCIIDKQEREKHQKNEIYSVKNDILVENDKDYVEAQAICKYVDDMLVSQIFDIKSKKWRAVELSDIVILLRNRGSLMSSIESALAAHGIPVIADNKEDIRQNGQVQVLLNFIKLALSSKDKVAWTSVLLSKLGGMTIGEISQIAMQDGQTLLDKIFAYGGEKLQKLQKNIEIFKKESEIFGLRRAFEFLFDRCDFFAYLKTLGEEQVLIVEKFLTAISQSGQDGNLASLYEYIQNYSQTKINTEQTQNAVKLMTIHGSKGMEYPIVILAGCGKPILSPARTSYLISKNLGLCTHQFDLENMTKNKTPQFEAAKILKKRSEMIDELMIFYVALTRAKNRLVLTGGYDVKKNFASGDMFDARCYFDWIFFGKQNLLENLKSQDRLQDDLAIYTRVDGVENLQKIQKENFVYEKDEKLVEKIAKYLNFEYKNLKLSKIEYKNSVTGLLKLELKKLDEETQNLPTSHQKTALTAADLGTIYHTALKEIDFEKIQTFDDTRAQIEKLVQNGYLSESEAKNIDLRLLHNSLTTLKKLTHGKKVFKEKPFMMSLPLCEVTDFDSQDKVLVQGVVDMFALGEENILVDYKFSSISDRDQLAAKYKKQIDLYSKAIEYAFGIKLNKKYIFSIKKCDLIEII